MRDDRRNYLLVGGFVLLMLAGLVVWIALLTGRTGATDSYFIQWSNVMGLSSGTQVLYEGYPLGIVEDIAPLREGGEQGFRVEVGVERGWRIPEDSVAEISAAGLLAAVVIDIRAGASQRALDPGSRIPSREAVNVFSVLASVADQFAELAETSLKPLLDDLSEGAPEIVDNLSRFTAELRDVVGRIDALLGPTNRERIDRILANVDTSSAHLARISSDLRGTRAELDELLVSMNRLLDENREELDHTLEDLHHSLEEVARHAHAISANLEATTRNMNEFSEQIRRNPGVLVRGRSSDGGAAEAE